MAQSSANPYPRYSKQWIITDKTAVEAGYVNNPNDPGGETNCGITKKLAVFYKAKLVSLFNWDGTMRNLTKPMAFYIYDMEFWQKLALDDVFKRCPLIADKMFDAGINIGGSVVGKWFQLILTVMNNQGQLYPDLVPDGNIGPRTIAAMDSYLKARGNKVGRWTILKLLLAKQGSHYVDISFANGKLETFTQGWANRLDHNLVDYWQTLNQ